MRTAAQTRGQLLAREARGEQLHFDQAALNSCSSPLGPYNFGSYSLNSKQRAHQAPIHHPVLQFLPHLPPPGYKYQINFEGAVSIILLLLPSLKDQYFR